MLRTTFYLPEELHERLKIASKKQKKSISGLAKEYLNEGLSEEDNKNVDEIYSQLYKLIGIGGKAPEPYKSIDEILYGENGAWRGSERDKKIKHKK